jgi:AraC-like DNA-binding protein
MVRKLTKEKELGIGNILASKKHLDCDCHVHWHEFYEIEYVLDGEGNCSINEQTYPLHHGTLFFMTPVDLHSVKTSNSNVINIMFSTDMVSPDVLSPYTTIDAPKAIKIDEGDLPFIESVLFEIIKSQESTALCSSLMSVLLIKLKDYLTVSKKDAHHTLSQKMCFFMINHFREKITLSDVAKAVGITPVYASKIFKAQTQMGFKEYLNSLRFEYAKKLLNESELTVQQICDNCGFEDYPNFIRRFKNRFNMSPTKYKKICFEKNDCN